MPPAVARQRSLDLAERLRRAQAQHHEARPASETERLLEMNEAYVNVLVVIRSRLPKRPWSEGEGDTPARSSVGGKRQFDAQECAKLAKESLGACW